MTHGLAVERRREGWSPHDRARPDLLEVVAIEGDVELAAGDGAPSGASISVASRSASKTPRRWMPTSTRPSVPWHRSTISTAMRARVRAMARRRARGNVRASGAEASRRFGANQARGTGTSEGPAAPVGAGGAAGRPARRDQAGSRVASSPTSTRPNSAGGAHVLLDLPEEVQHAGRRGQVDELVEPPPAGPAEPPHHPGRRGERQRHQHEPRREARRDPRVLHDVLADFRERERLVEYDVRREMQGCEEEGKEAEEPPELDDFIPPGGAAERRDGQGQEEPDEGTLPGPALNRLDRVRAERVVERPPHEPGRDAQPDHPDQRLGDPSHDLGTGHVRLSSWSADSCRCRASPPGRRTR